MTGRRHAVLVLATAFVLSVGYAAQASAAAKLVVTFHGSPAPVGTPAQAFMDVYTGANTESAACLQGYDEGTVDGNVKAKDAVTLGTLTQESCAEGSGYSISGKLTTAKLASSGAVQVKASPKLAIATPEGCVYEFSTLGVTYAIPGDAFNFEPDADVAKLNKKKSAASCAKTRSFLVDLGLFGEEPNGSGTGFDLELLGS